MNMGMVIEDKCSREAVVVGDDARYDDEERVPSDRPVRPLWRLTDLLSIVFFSFSGFSYVRDFWRSPLRMC